MPTRRQVVAGAGAALGAPAVAHAAGPARVGVAPEARQAVGVIGTILQDALALVGFGYLTDVAGLSADALFTDPANRGPATARLRWHAEVHVTALDLLPALFSGTGTGQLRFFFDPDGGATDGEP